MNILISPSLMCMDFMHISEQLKVLNEKSDFYHLDIIDGSYVKNLALSPEFVRQIKPYTDVVLDAHLVMSNPMDYFEELVAAGVDFFSIQADVIERSAFSTIRKIHNSGKKIGIVLNPAVPVSMIGGFIHLLDKVTVMTVEPGFAGQPFIPEMLDKIRELKKIKTSRNLNFLIEADGCCNKSTYAQLLEAGTEVLILGSSGLFRKDMSISESWELMITEIRTSNSI